MKTKYSALTNGHDPVLTESVDWLNETTTYTKFRNTRDTDTGPHKQVTETFAEFIDGNLQPQPQSEKDGPAIVCGTFLEGCGRKNEAVACINFIQLDFDNTADGVCATDPVTMDKIEAWLERETWAGFIYETYSNSENWPKLRVVLFLTAPIQIRDRPDDPDAPTRAALYKRFYAHIADRSGFDYDTTCASLGRLFYLPAYQTGKNKSHSKFVSGSRIDFQAIVAALPSIERPARPRVGNEKSSPERQTFDKIWNVIRPHLLVAEFLEGIPDWGLVTGENGKAQGCCPWQDDHKTTDPAGATPAYAFDADVAEHGVATIGCLHHGCEGKTSGDFIFELMQRHGFAFDELRQFLTDEGQIAYDAVVQTLPPSKAELDGAFANLEALIADQKQHELIEANLSKSMKLKAILCKYEDEMFKARHKAVQAGVKLDQVTLKADKEKALVSSLAKKLTKKRIKAAERDKLQAELRTAELKANEAELALNQAKLEVEHAVEVIGLASTKCRELGEKISELEIAGPASPDRTAEIEVAQTELAKRLAMFGEGLDRESYIEKLAALANKSAARLRNVLREERRAAEASMQPDLTPTLEAYNERYCLVRVGKSSEIAEKPKRAGEPYNFLRLETFRTERAPDRRLAQQWIQWPERDLRTSVCFKPHAGAWDEHAEGQLNLWTGLPFTGESGDWGLLRQWIWEDACHRNPLWFATFMSWLADIVQDPGHKKGSSLVLMSAAKGTGKSHLANVIGRLLGRYASAGITNPDQVAGKFNAVLAEKLFITLEEAFFAGHHAMVNTLKAIITEPMVMIERKGVDPIKSENYCRVMIATNQAWAVNTDGTDERRYFVLNISDAHAKDPAYWKPLADQMADEAGMKAFLYDLERVCRPSFVDLRNPPQTPWLAEQALHSLPCEARWLHNVLSEQVIVFEEDEFWPWEFAGEADCQKSELAGRCKGVPTETVFNACRQFAGRSGIKSRLTPEDLGRYLKPFGVTRSRPREGAEKRTYYYRFPQLEVMRKLFTAKYGIRFDGELADDATSLDLTRFGLDGLPENELEAWRAYGEGRGGPPCRQ